VRRCRDRILGTGDIQRGGDYLRSRNVGAIRSGKLIFRVGKVDDLALSIVIAVEDSRCASFGPWGR
jgi:hypothetical protein